MITRLFYKKASRKISHGDYLEGEETIIERLCNLYSIHESNDDCYWSYQEDDGSTTLIAFSKEVLKSIK